MRPFTSLRILLLPALLLAASSAVLAAPVPAKTLPAAPAANAAPPKATPAALPSPLTDHETLLTPGAGAELVRHYLRPGRKDTITPWTPTAQDLRQLQAAFAKAAPGVGQPDPMRSIIRTDVTDYYRQYVPVVQNGRRLILISGLSPAALAPDLKTAAGRDAWRMSGIFIFDAGRDAFHAIYDPAKGKITLFAFSGD